MLESDSLCGTGRGSPLPRTPGVEPTLVGFAGGLSETTALVSHPSVMRINQTKDRRPTWRRSVRRAQWPIGSLRESPTACTMTGITFPLSTKSTPLAPVRTATTRVAHSYDSHCHVIRSGRSRECSPPQTGEFPDR